MSILKKAFLAGSLLVAGCTATTATRTGATSYQSLSADSAVAVYANERDVKTPFEVVGLVYHVDPGKFQRIALEDVMPALKAQARALGADALIVDQVEPTRSGWVSAGLSVLARAIRTARDPKAS